jgi:hypothetical protein
MIDISFAQLHLALNHLPVVSTLLSAGILTLGAIIRHPGTRRFGLGLLVFAALSGLPPYFTGEGAEKVVEHRPGVSETLIERHEEAAGRALAVTLTAGACAAIALFAMRMRRERLVSIFFATALVAALASTALMGHAAHLGGQIRHDELRPQSTSQSNVSELRGPAWIAPFATAAAKTRTLQ